MAREADYYTAHETARVLGISPARVRQMLRAGELEGERGPSLVEGRRDRGSYRRARCALTRRAGGPSPPIPSRCPAAMPREAISRPDEPPSGTEKADKPTEISEPLSEEVGALRDKAEEILAELDRLEGRLEAAEVEQLSLREAARERAERLQAELDGVRFRSQSGQRAPRRRPLGG